MTTLKDYREKCEYHKGVKAALQKTGLITDATEYTGSIDLEFLCRLIDCVDGLVRALYHEAPKGKGISPRGAKALAAFIELDKEPPTNGEPHAFAGDGTECTACGGGVMHYLHAVAGNG